MVREIKQHLTNHFDESAHNVDGCHKIFISYKRDDKAKVIAIKEKIERNVGVSCWIDLEGIESDAQFAKVIMKAIDEASIFLFMYSKCHTKINDYEKDWTIREIGYAEDENKRIVFVNIDRTPLSKWFKLMFKYKQQVDGTSKEAVNKMIEDIKIWLNIQNPQPTIQTKSQQINNYKRFNLKKWVSSLFKRNEHTKPKEDTQMDEKKTGIRNNALGVCGFVLEFFGYLFFVISMCLNGYFELFDLFLYNTNGIHSIINCCIVIAGICCYKFMLKDIKCIPVKTIRLCITSLIIAILLMVDLIFFFPWSNYKVRLFVIFEMGQLIGAVLMLLGIFARRVGSYSLFIKQVKTIIHKIELNKH